MKIKFLLLLFSSFFIHCASALTTYTVGAGGSYTTILAAYNACTAADVYVIDIRSDYVQEALPIVLGALTNKDATNTVTIRPQTGNTVSLANTGTESYIFQFTSANYVIIDGRAGGVGVAAFTIANNQTAKGQAVRLDGTCSYITVKYCTINGSNAATGVGSATTDAGIFQIGESGAGNFSNITLDNCTLQKGSGGSPTYLFVSFSNTGSITSSTISNCSFIDAVARSICFSTGSTGWSVTGCSFYQTGNITPDITNTFCFIRVVVGGGYTFTGNFIGGRNATATGTAFVINSVAQKIHIISFDSACTGTNVVSNNTIQNITATTTHTGNPAFSCLYIGGGTGTYTVGSVGNGNTFGATGYGISITDNGSSSTASIALIYNDGSGTTNVTYNNFGVITLAGSNLVGNFMPLYTAGSNAATFSNNTVGTTTANNMSDGIARTGWFYYGVLHESTGALTASSNTVRNFSLTGASTGPARVFYTTTASSATISSNTISSITSARTTGSFRPIYVSIAGAITASSNTISGITLSDVASIFYGIDLTSSAGALTCNSNSVGSATANNMSLAGNTFNIAILLSIPAGITATMNSNFTQQFNLTSSGTSASLYAYYIAGAGSISMTGNIVKDITLATTKAGGTFSFIGIDLLNTGNSNTIVQNRMYKITMTSMAAVSVIITGIYTNGAVTSSTMNKNKIVNMTNTTTSTPAIYGIYSATAVSGWSFFNNVILLSNGSNTNACGIYGIYSYGSSTTVAYHNTIKITGSTSTGAENSYAFHDGAAATTTRTFKNNIFYNLRTGAGNHRAFRNINSSGLTMNYNYHEYTNQSKWNDVAYTFANFVAAPQANAPNEKNGTITIDANGGVSSGSAGNIADLGANLLGSVADDYDAVARDAAPWIGAFESITTLPIELLAFSGEKRGDYNELSWETAAELNNDFFTIEKTEDGISFEIVGRENGAGTSIIKSNYKMIDNNVKPIINYYRLIQTDFDGKSETSNLISIDNSRGNSSKEVTSTVNILGQEVSNEYRGLVIISYSDGTSMKIIR